MSVFCSVSYIIWYMSHNLSDHLLIVPFFAIMRFDMFDLK